MRHSPTRCWCTWPPCWPQPAPRYRPPGARCASAYWTRSSTGSGPGGQRPFHRTCPPAERTPAHKPSPRPRRPPPPPAGPPPRQQAIAAATLLAPPDEAATTALLTLIEDFSDAAAGARAAVATWLHELYPGADPPWISPLRPDLLTEQLLTTCPDLAELVLTG